MPKVFNICNLYTFLWCIYSLQGALYERGSRVSQLILVFNLLISIYFAFKFFSKITKNPPYLKGVIVFLLLGVVYGLIRLAFSSDIVIYDYVQDRFSYLKVFLVSFLPILTYYYFSHKGYINEDWISTWFFVFLSCALLSFFGEQYTAYGSASMRGYIQEQYRTSVGYKYAVLLPALAYFYRKSFVKYGLTILIITLTFFALKRGAILTVFIASIYMVWQSSFSSKRKSIAAPIIGLIMIIGVVVLFRYLIESNSYFQMRFTETLSGDVSGRDDLYPLFLDTFLHKSSFLHQLFGYGANGSLMLFDVYAHNDWLELAIDTGILGMIIYLYYWISLYKSMREARIYQPAYLAIGLFMIIEFTRALFSMSYESLSIFSTSVLAYSVCITANKKIMVNE